ncbi:hypothetical protein NLJ89_g7298 [Agrocybe chaxingu]|uniref:Uncharacterized protein n=1 Tax=Agrocybe chaxingu TaxID=84603 RepID=A0A9W8MRW3_9AGAR|nr:hypothetical protein NLJ89_g7298 [Agrocybe chaxingu]
MSRHLGHSDLEARYTTDGADTNDTQVEPTARLVIRDGINANLPEDGFRNLTHLVITSRLADIFVLASLVVEQATNLAHCVLKLQNVVVPGSASLIQSYGSRLVTNTSLRHLSLESMPEWGPDNALVLFLDRMRLPGLDVIEFKGLMLNTWGPRPFSPMGIITSFLERSTCMLSELKFDLCYGWEHDFIELLGHSTFNSLRTLHLDEAPVTEIFFKLLVEKTSKGRSMPSLFLPNLKKITYRGEKDFWWDTIFKVVKAHQYPRKRKCLRPLLSLEVETYEDGLMEEPPRSPLWTIVQNFKSGVTKVSWKYRYRAL